MFFFLTKKLVKKFAREAHKYLKASYDPWKMNPFQVFLFKKRIFERHHYRIGSKKLVML